MAGPEQDKPRGFGSGVLPVREEKWGSTVVRIASVTDRRSRNPRWDQNPTPTPQES